MANNRVSLVNKVTGERVMLAKYYPSTGWYAYWSFDPNGFIEALNKALAYEDYSQWGAPAFELEYEDTSANLPEILS